MTCIIQSLEATNTEWLKLSLLSFWKLFLKHITVVFVKGKKGSTEAKI